MRFTAERDKLSGVCRNLARIVPDVSPIADLTGILMEADENTGNLRLTANNMEIAIQYDCHAIVAEGGMMVLNAKLISEMIPMFSDEHVHFTARQNSTVLIQGGNASFCISCLPGTHYPKPELPEPESMVVLSGLHALTKKTAFAASKQNKDKSIYSNVRLEAYPAELRMIATDTIRLAVARHNQVTGGEAVLLIPASALPVLTGITGDEPVRAGMSKNHLVFKGSDFVLTTRTMMGEFMDVNELLKTVQPLYDALVSVTDLRTAVDSLETVVQEGSPQMNLIMGEAGITLSYEGETSKSQTGMEAVVYRPTPDAGFYYGMNGFMQALRYMEGNIRLLIDRYGMLLLKNDEQCYLLSSVRKRKPVVKKPEEAKPAKKKNNKKTEAAKAA